MVQVCLFPDTVVHTDPPFTYVNRFGTSGLPAEPNALWHPLHASANDAGRAAPAWLGAQAGADPLVADPLVAWLPEVSLDPDPALPLVAVPEVTLPLPLTPPLETPEALPLGPT